MISDAAAVSSIYHDIFLLPCFIISSILNGICEEARIHADQWQDAIPFTSLNSHTLYACATDAETVSEQEHTEKKHSNWFLDSRKLLNTRAVLLDFIACKLAIYGERDRPINANELIRWNWYNLVELLDRNVCIYSAVTFSNQMNPKLVLQN